MIPEGKYLATISDKAIGTTKKGDPQLVLGFTIDEGEQIGQRITAYRYFTPGAMKYTLADLRTCGWKSDDPFDLDSVGGQVRIVVKHEEFEGKTQAKVKFINSLNFSKPPDDAKRDELRARVKAALSGGDPRPEAPPPDDLGEPPPF